MNRNLKIVRLFAFIIGVVAILVMLGWVFDVGLLKSLNPSWVTMKLHTSVAFLLTALISGVRSPPRNGFVGGNLMCGSTH